MRRERVFPAHYPLSLEYIMSRTLTLKWLVVLGVASLFYALAPRTVSPQMPLYLGMTSAAVVIWTFDLLPAVAVAAALTFLYLLTNMAPPEVVLGPWTTVLIWTTFGAAIFGEAMEKTGLAKRVALRCMLLTGGTFAGMLIGLAIGCIILGLLLASGFARTVIFCAIAVGIVKALDIDPKSRLSSVIVLACFFAAAASTMQFLHTSESFIWSFRVLMEAIGGNVDWWEYLNHECLVNTIYVILTFLTLYFMRGKDKLPEGGKLKSILQERLAEMGPMSTAEKRLLILAVLGILGFMVEPWTGVNAVYVLCLVALFCYMPGMKIMEPSSFNNLNIVFLVFVAGCMAIGFVAGEVGANKWAVSAVIPFLKELPPTLGVLSSYFAGVITNLLLTPFAATVAFTPAFGELGLQMGINPLPLFYAFEYGLDQYFFPYEGVMFLYMFTTGCVTLKHIIPIVAARCVVAGIFIAIIAIPYWKFIGIM